MLMPLRALNSKPIACVVLPPPYQSYVVRPPTKLGLFCALALQPYFGIPQVVARQIPNGRSNVLRCDDHALHPSGLSIPGIIRVA